MVFLIPFGEDNETLLRGTAELWRCVVLDAEFL